MGCLSGYLVASAFAGAAGLLLVYPLHPVTTLGWVLWFLFALPIVAIGELIADATLGRLGRRIDPSRDFSVKRVATLLILGLAVVALGVLWSLEGVPDPGEGGFWDTHFSESW
jgi:hypothetical protein